jgi:E3 ubiquitin-protein ligase DOA10
LRSTLHCINHGNSATDDESRKRNRLKFVDSENDLENISVEGTDTVASSSKKTKLQDDSSAVTSSSRVLSSAAYKSAEEASAAREATKVPTALKSKIVSKSEKMYAELAARENRSERLRRSAEYLQQQKVSWWMQLYFSRDF